MLKIKPEIWTRNGREAFVVMSLSDFKKLEELLEDAGLSRILGEARKQNAKSPTISLADMKRRLGSPPGGRRRPGERRGACPRRWGRDPPAMCGASPGPNAFTRSKS